MSSLSGLLQKMNNFVASVEKPLVQSPDKYTLCVSVWFFSYPPPCHQFAGSIQNKTKKPLNGKRWHHAKFLERNETPGNLFLCFALWRKFRKVFPPAGAGARRFRSGLWWQGRVTGSWAGSWKFRSSLACVCVHVSLWVCFFSSFAFGRKWQRHA